MSTRPQPPSQASKRAPAPTFQDVKEYIQGLTKVNLENSNANYRTTAFELCRVRGPGTWHVWVRDRSTLATVAGSVVVDSSREVQAKLLNKINLKPVSTKPQPPPKPAPAPRFEGVREYIQGLTNVNLENSNANYRTAAFELCRVRGPGTWHVWVRERSTLATVASAVVDSSREVQAKLLNGIKRST